MILRELKQIQIILGPSVADDRVSIVVRAFDDTDEEIVVQKVKELNVGAQLQEMLEPFVARVLEKASSAEKPVARPTEVPL
jgi:hypothetical protein